MRIEPMTDAHAHAVLAIYQAGIDEGDATFETEACKTSAFFLACQVSVRLLAQALDEEVDECASRLAVALAGAQNSES